jgi:micrococcal nuclease
MLIAATVIAVILLPLTLSIFVAWGFYRSSKINQKFKIPLIIAMILVGFSLTSFIYSRLIGTEFVIKKFTKEQITRSRKIETEKAPTETKVKGQNDSKKQKDSDSFIEADNKTKERKVNQESQGEKTIVNDVIDGDTIVLASNEIVRLIGINTPEKGQFYYEEAKKELEKLVLEKEVLLKKDVSDRDRYGRLLRYVYVDNLFINLEMIKRGYANVFTYPPDVKYNQEFLAAEKEARKKEIGLWQKSDKEIKISVVLMHADAAGNDNYNLNDEYVVFKNMGNSTINMTGWTIKDAATHIYTFSNFSLAPGVSFTLYTGIGENANDKLYWNRTSDDGAVWNNSGDTLYLRDEKGQLVLIFNY